MTAACSCSVNTYCLESLTQLNFKVTMVTVISVITNVSLFILGCNKELEEILNLFLCSKMCALIFKN